MAAYPSIPFTFGSDATIKDGVVVDRAMNGAGRGRNLYDAKKYLFSLRHIAVTTADKDTLEAFYDTNRAAPVSLTWTDATTRTVILTGIKIVPGVRKGSDRLWDVAVTGEQV